MKKHVMNFLRDRRGSILIIAGLALAMSVGIGGAAYDFGMQRIAYNNSQHAADTAATSAAGARMNETWGKGTDVATLQEQERRVRMFYDVNSRGYDVDPTFEITRMEVIDVPGTPDKPGVYKTIVEGQGKIPANFISVIGVKELPYEIQTVTNLRNPGEEPIYDMVLLLDYTTSMTASMGDGDTRLDALRKASKFLTRTVMCGNDQGTECKQDNKNRIGMIPYGLTAVGLDECDFPNPPAALQCHCRMPRGYEDPTGNFDTPEEAWETLHEHEGGMPESCRSTCDRVDENGLPASDPGSEQFNCSCWQGSANGKPLPPAANAPVDGSMCSSERCPPRDLNVCLSNGQQIRIDEQLGYPKRISVSCVPFCQKNYDGDSGEGCCNPCDKSDDFAKGSLQWAQCTMGRANPGLRTHIRDSFGCGCRQPIEYVPYAPGLENNNRYTCADSPTEGTFCIRWTGTPDQTFACHHAACTCSCSAAGSGVNPCAADPKPAHCLPPENPPQIPPKPNVPGLGFNGTTPQAQFAAAVGVSEDELFSAVYKPGADRFALGKGNDPKVILAQASGGVWARSLYDCKQSGPTECMTGMETAFDSNYLEANTNSFSAFAALFLHQDYLNFMRPNSTEPDKVVDVVVWVTDGENNRYQMTNMNGQKVTIPDVQLMDTNNDGVGDKWQCAGSVCTPAELEVLKLNRYNGQGGYIPEGHPSYNQALTAQQWSDRMTLQKCQQLRTRVDYSGQSRPVIIYTVAVGDVGNLNSPVGKHTAEVMNECSYGIAGMQTDVPPTGQPKRFFAVQDSADLNAAFRTIANSMGRIRIVD